MSIFFGCDRVSDGRVKELWRVNGLLKYVIDGKITKEVKNTMLSGGS